MEGKEKKISFTMCAKQGLSEQGKEKSDGGTSSTLEASKEGKSREFRF